MGTIFDPEHEEADNRVGWALGLSIVGLAAWIVCYVLGIMLIYGFICPVVLACGVWYACVNLRDERSGQGWLLLAFSLVCFAVSLLPWLLPIATLNNL